MSLPLLRSLRNDPNLCVGDNQPYDAREHVGYTIETHGGANGFPHVLIEVRQDLIETEAGIMIWADLLAEHLMPILADDELYHRWDCD
jgi:predicted N-formylglutamate amidohydrolase